MVRAIASDRDEQTWNFTPKVLKCIQLYATLCSVCVEICYAMKLNVMQ